MQTVVRTRRGAVQGSTADGVAAFKGIPYAAPPFGPNRFQPPRPAESWEGVRAALTYGPTAPKAPYFPPFDVLLPEVAIEGSDCLNLNIWSPDLGEARLPVMVWIHGGAFLNGSGAWPTYDGTRLPEMGSSASPSTIAWEPTASSPWGLAWPTSASLTRLLPSPGCRRTSPPSAVIRPTSPSLASRLAG